MDKKKRTRKEIVGEYLAGGKTYRELAAESGINFRTINRWVLADGRKRRITRSGIEAASAGVPGVEYGLPREVGRLQSELRKAQLHNKLLNAMIDIAEEQMGVSIRKKPGSKR
jgi:transposase-like protein